MHSTKNVPRGNIRNFSIIAHIDHGKTTLTDRLLQATHTLAARDFRERMLDSNPIEQERGITIKLAPVRMEYVSKQNGQQYELNLIDTPGHVDFGYEVSRSLAACEGALLVVDATQGIQAQTLSNYHKAKAVGLKVIPLINKVDLPAADPDKVALEIIETFGIQEQDILRVSAKTGLGVPELLENIVEHVPSPTADEKKPLRILVFTSLYDPHKGVIAYVRVMDGVLRREQLSLLATQTTFLPTEIGIFRPGMEAVEELRAGEVGYIATGLKDVTLVRVGDTITTKEATKLITPLPGYKEPQPIVFMEFYPIDGDDYTLLLDAMGKLALHDAALHYQQTHSTALGNGLRVGFLGILHAEIVQERLEREFNLELIATSPSVPYVVILTSGKELRVETPADLPDPSEIREIREPMTMAEIYAPKEYVGSVMRLCEEHRAQLQDMQTLGNQTELTYLFPLAELIVQFHDQLKSVSSGFASVEYELIGFEQVDAVKLDILVHGQLVEALSHIVVRRSAEYIGRRLVKKLKEVIPRQQFEVAIQAAIGGKIVARETIPAYRKDVTAKLYGGDQTRKDKLLKKQKKGKKRMKEFGKVSIPQEAFLAILEK